jgi:hypothetical protein
MPPGKPLPEVGAVDCSHGLASFFSLGLGAIFGSLGVGLGLTLVAAGFVCTLIPETCSGFRAGSQIAGMRGINAKGKQLHILNRRMHPRRPIRPRQQPIRFVIPRHAPRRRVPFQRPSHLHRHIRKDA